MAQLKRSLGLIQAASVGIAQIIGAGIFVLSGVAAGIAGPSVLLSFLIAGLIAMLTALSSAEISSFITETGASYTYTKLAFGRFWGFLVGWFKYFDYIVGAAAVSIGFSGYFSAAFGVKDPIVLLLVTLSLPIFFTVLNIIGVTQTAIVTSAMVFIKVFSLVLLLMVGGYYLKDHFDPSHYEPFFATGIEGTLHGSTIIFAAFLGFNTILMMSEETKNPERIIPKAIFLAFIVAFILYMGIGFLEIGVLSWKELGLSSDPMSLLAKAILDNRMFFEFISFSALIAVGSVALGSITGGARASFAMSRDGLLPKCFGVIHKRFQTPHISILLSCLFIVVLVILFKGNIETIASVYNFGTLFTFFFIHLSLIRFRTTMRDATRYYKVSYPIVPILGMISSLGLMFFLSGTAKVASLIWGSLGLLTYLIMARVKKIKLN